MREKTNHNKLCSNLCGFQRLKSNCPNLRNEGKKDYPSNSLVTNITKPVRKKLITEDILSRTGIILRSYYLPVFLIILCITAFLLSPHFLTLRNLVNILLQNSILSIISLGMLCVVITGGIDLSVGSCVALSCSLTALLLKLGVSPFAVVVIVLFIAMLLGLFNGVLISYGGIPPFIATLAGMTMFRGLAYMVQTGEVTVIYNMKFVNMFSGRLGGFFPIPVIYMMMLTGIVEFVLTYTTLGRGFYLIGANKESARLIGIKTSAFLVTAYVISGILAGMAGVLLAARLRLGTAVAGIGYELDAITAVIIGGASFFGGKGRALNAVLGTFVLGIMTNVMNLLGVATYPQMVVKGIILVLAVLLMKE